MIEKVYKLAQTDEKTIERILFDENLHYLHMVFGKGDSTPEHYTNSNVYMTVLRGRLSIALGEQGVREYEKGTMLKIPNNTKMTAGNSNDEILEIVVVKAPAPVG
ncbi:MAG: cupin domain-containing protein [Anaerovoracaceae bacterium]|jgi:quercetin dioxygenase-like cupin family protein